MYIMIKTETKPKWFDSKHKYEQHLYDIKLHQHHFGCMTATVQEYSALTIFVLRNIVFI